MNVERAQDVLMHKGLLHMAHVPATRPTVEAHFVQVTISLIFHFGGNYALEN